MIPVSNRWLEAVQGTHTAFEELWLTSEDPPRRLVIDRENTGEVIEDEDAKIRHNGSFTIMDEDEDLVPLGYRVPVDPLNPLGKPVVRYVRGIVHPDEEREPVTQATMLVRNVRVNRSTPGRLELTCFDTFADMQRLSARSIVIPPGRNAAVAIRQVLWLVNPRLPFQLPTTPYSFASLVYNVQSDYVQVAIDLAASIGMDVHMDRLGNCILEPTPLRNGPVHWRWSADTGAFVDDDLTNEWDADNIPNGVVVTGQHSSMTEPLHGQAWDENPSSPTYRYGPFGENPRFITTEKATTINQLNAMARAELQRIAGGMQEITLRIPANAAVMSGDRALLNFPRQGITDLICIVRRIHTVAGDTGALQEVVVRRGVAADDG